MVLFGIFFETKVSLMYFEREREREKAHIVMTIALKLFYSCFHTGLFLVARNKHTIARYCNIIHPLGSSCLDHYLCCSTCMQVKLNVTFENIIFLHLFLIHPPRKSFSCAVVEVEKVFHYRTVFFSLNLFMFLVFSISLSLFLFCIFLLIRMKQYPRGVMWICFNYTQNSTK